MSPETEKPIQNQCSIKEAKEILGKNNVFGPDEWKKFFGNKVSFTPDQLTKIAELPWSTGILEKPGINKQHFLFLGLERLNAIDGPVFDVQNWPYILDNFLKDKSRKPVICAPNQNPFRHPLLGMKPQTRWYLTPIDNFGLGHTYKRQIELLPTNYEVMSPAERGVGNILYYLLNKKYLETMSFSALTNTYTEGHDTESEESSNEYPEMSYKVRGHVSGKCIALELEYSNKRYYLIIDQNKKCETEKDLHGFGRLAVSLKLL